MPIPNGALPPSAEYSNPLITPDTGSKLINTLYKGFVNSGLTEGTFGKGEPMEKEVDKTSAHVLAGNSKKLRNKRKSKQAQRVCRQVERESAVGRDYTGDGIDPCTLRKHFENAQTKETEFNTSKLCSALTGYVGLPSRGGGVYILEDLVGKQGFTLVKQAKSILNKDGHDIALLAGHPNKDLSWEEVHRSAFAQYQESKKRDIAESRAEVEEARKPGAFCKEHEGAPEHHKAPVVSEDIRFFIQQGDDNWVQMARTSANKAGTHHKRALRSPILVEHLSALRCAITLSDPFHAAVWAVAICTFFECCRLGETTVTSAVTFDKRYHILCSVTITFNILQDGSRLANFRIPWTKTTKEAGASIILTGRPSSLCPVAALKNHLSVNSSIPPSLALFAYASSLGQPKNLLKHKFFKFVTSIWAAAGLAHILGHSFRIGALLNFYSQVYHPKLLRLQEAGPCWCSSSIAVAWRRSFP
ncbi:hypothetical protein B0H34DRAFT_855291 [Crassisporium funariophilum]|nr:hypothetical protein B0H34DRAFT_855291 [Crassisporium funariophilum]